MIYFLFYALQILVVIVLFSTMILSLLWAVGNLKNKVPFVTASSAVLKDVEKALNVKDNSVVYDLGCGDGRILFHLSNSKPKAKYIGIENSLFPVLLSRFQSFLINKKTGNNVEIINGDFFKQDLSNATHVFTYLYPSLMDELLPKFEKEFKHGTRLVSLSFKFTGKNPVEEIDLKRNKYKLGRKLYVYEF
jgi:SAM-dependent methyltransferase